MRIAIHDLPITGDPLHPGVDFHATKDAIDRVWWDGEILEVVTVKGEVWRLDFDEERWSHTETIGI